MTTFKTILHPKVYGKVRATHRTFRRAHFTLTLTAESISATQADHSRRKVLITVANDAFQTEIGHLAKGVGHFSNNTIENMLHKLKTQRQTMFSALHPWLSIK